MDNEKLKEKIEQARIEEKLLHEILKANSKIDRLEDLLDEMETNMSKIKDQFHAVWVGVGILVVLSTIGMVCLTIFKSCG